MEPKEKQTIADLFQNKKFLYTLPIFLIAIAGIVYYLMQDTAAAPATTPSALNTSVPSARPDTLDRSKLGLQQEGNPDGSNRLPTGDFQSNVPQGIERLMYDKSATPVPVGYLNSQGRQGMAMPYDTNRTRLRNSRAGGLPGKLNPSHQRNDNGVMGLSERDSQLNGYDTPRSQAVDPQVQARQQAELQQAKQQQAKLLSLLEEYKKDKQIRKKNEEDKTKVDRADPADPVSSLNGIDREKGNNTFYGLYTDDNKKQQQAQLDKEVGTFRAVVYGDQDVVSSGRVRMRLLEPLRVRGGIIPANTIIYGIGSFQAERVAVKISGILYQNHELPVNLSVIDEDGIPGIYVPNIIGQAEARQALSQSANGIQISTYGGSGLNPATMVGNSAATAALQGARQLVQRKTTIQKAHLKNNYYIHLKSTDPGRTEQQ
ncbi:conjugative transposon TraM protein [Spirosoma oryzae]|uniref:Conjugative transposon TraM protein n=1 Tax=Spirosoma oryzae TaxID=1469603 RepID=A0A2T0S341_9BACT|nr:conjugative transposon protein TraM [Spirosoma oryzae]PRY27822.1 conjugative transposon TraM protein [Spirosoma oryzae]